MANPDNRHNTQQNTSEAVTPLLQGLVLDVPHLKKRGTPLPKSAPPRIDVPCGDVIAKPPLGTCTAGFKHDHSSMYVSTDQQSCQRTCPLERETSLQRVRQKNAELQRQLEDLKEKQRITKRSTPKHSSSKSKRFSIDDIKNKERLMKLYTGLQSYAVFMWVFDHVKSKMGRLHYYRGRTSHKTKRWQTTGAAKPGQKRELSKEDELLLTLMKLRLNLNDEDLAVRFCVSTSVISNIISTLLPFLANELKSLIYWPSRSAVQNHFPSCFKKHGQVRAIIDCFEVQTQRPSQSDVNSKLYSSYKQRHTYKVLVACTPGGSVSFLSPTAGGNMSDIEIVRKSGMLDLLENGDVVLADKGFKDKSDFLLHGCKLVIPLFSKKGKVFTEEANITNAAVSNSRIHIERVIGRMKEFQILKGDFPLLRSDIVDHVFTLCGVLVNLQSVLVPK